MHIDEIRKKETIVVYDNDKKKTQIGYVDDNGKIRTAKDTTVKKP